MRVPHQWYHMEVAKRILTRSKAWENINSTQKELSLSATKFPAATFFRALCELRCYGRGDRTVERRSAGNGETVETIFLRLLYDARSN